MDSEKMTFRQQIQTIEEKVQQALQKKRETIEKLAEELRLKEVQVEKYKAMMDRQRKELLKWLNIVDWWFKILKNNMLKCLI